MINSCVNSDNNIGSYILFKGIANENIENYLKNIL